MNVIESLYQAGRVVGFGLGILRNRPPPVSREPAIVEMRQAERELRANSLLLVRDLRTDNLARLQRRLSGNV